MNIFKQKYLKSIVAALCLLMTFSVQSQDDCASATPVTDLTGAVCATSSVGGTSTLGAGSCEEGTFDTWFSFVAQATSATIDVSSTSGGFRPEYLIISSDDNTCGGNFTQENCIDQNGNYTSISGVTNALTIGDTYWVVVSSNGDSTAGTLSVCVNNPIPAAGCVDNEDCATPAALTLNAPGGGSACVNDCNTGATAGPDFTGANCQDMPNGTVWYTITTSATTATLDISLTSGDMTTPEFVLFTTADCSSYTTVHCNEGSGGSATSTGISVSTNTTYLIAVSNVSGSSGNFDLCVTQNVDGSACNTTNTLAATATSMGSPLGGPYLPGEDVTFCYTLTDWEQVNCNYIGAFVPTFGDCWDPASFDAQGMPLNIGTPLNVNGVIQATGPPGPAGPQNPCAGDPAGSWNWFPAGAVQYNITGPVYGPGDDMPAGWYFLSSYDPATGLCTGNDPTSPNNSFGDGNYPACGVNTFDYTLCFTLTAGNNSCGVGGTGNIDCGVSIQTHADGEFGAWGDIGCTADSPEIEPGALICCVPPVMTNFTTGAICSNDNVNFALTSDIPATYSWIATADNPNVTGESLTAQASALINDTLINTSAVAQTVTYEATPTGTTPICLGVAQTITITVNPLPILALTSSSNPTTCLGTDGSIVLGTTNLVDGSYTVDYMDATPAAQTATMVVVGNVGTISGLAAGTYNDIAITVTSCTSVANIDVVLTDPLIPVLALTSSSNPTTCSGTDGSIVLGTTNLVDGSYTVDYMDATPSAQTATMVVVGNVGTISGLSAGTYNDITITNAGCTSVADIDVVLSPPGVPTLSLTSSSNPTTCSGTDGSIVLGTTNLVDGSYTVDYMDATPAAQTATMVVVGNVGTISGLSAGTYNNITITNAGCTSVDNVDVVLSDPLVPALALTSSSNPTTCLGTDGSIVLGTTNLVDGSYTVDYMDATPAAQTATMVVVGNVGTISGLSAGTYNDITITITGCTSVANIDVVLTDPLVPVLALTSSSNPTTCSGTDGSIVLGTTNLADGSYTVDYMDATPAAQTATMVVVGNVGTISGLSAGTYNDIAITITGCTSVADIDVVLADPLVPVLALTSSSSPTTCLGTDGSIVLGTTNLVDGSYTIDYMDATPAAQTATMVVVGNVGTISGLSAGTYNDIAITITGCTSVADIDVVLTDPLIPILALTSSSNPTTCSGTDGSIVLGTTNLVDGSYTVDYMDATPAAQTATMVVVGNVGTISGLSAGTYNDIAITITGCTSVADIDVVLSPPGVPTLSLTSSSNPTTCSGADGSIVLGTTNLADGSYTVDYMDATPAAQTATMVVVGNVGTISGLLAGTYNNITITNAGCTSVDNVDVVLSDPLVPVLALTSSSSPTTCLGTDGSIVLGTTNLVDGSYTVDYMDATPAAQTATMVVVGNVGTISGLSAGTYNDITITITGCTSVADIDVVLSDPLLPILALTSSSNPTTCLGTDGSIVLGTTNLADGSYTVDYMDATPAAQTATMVVVGNVGTISGLSAGTYNDITITITGCTSVADIDVVLADPLVPVLALTSSSSPTTCLGTDGSIVLGTTNLVDGSYTIDYMDATPAAQTATMVVVGNVGTISGLSAGTYNDIAITITGCTSVADIDVVLSDPLVPVLALTSSSNPTTCSGTDGSIVLGTTNLADGSYTVDYMDATPAAQTATMVVVGNVGTISGLSAGTYNDIAITITGCTSVADIDVVLSPPGVPTLSLTSSSNPTTCLGTDGSIVLGTTNLADGSYTVDYMDATPAAQTATMVVVGNVGTISGLSAGTYNNITITNAGCTSVDNVDVVLSDPLVPVLALTSSTNPTTCSGVDGSIVLGTTNLVDGSYTVDYMDATPAAQTATMVIVGNVGTISGLSAGTYNDITITITGCTSVADIDVVLSDPLLPILALTSSSNPTTCLGTDGSIVLGTTNLADGSYTVDYMDATPAAQTATMVVVGNVGTISGLSAGTYNDITITNTNCTSIADIDVVLSDPALPVLALTSSAGPTTCSGADGSIVLGTTNLADGSYTIDYMDATPAAQTATMVVVGNVGTISGLSAGTYNDITVTNTNCTSIADIDVVLSDPALPVLALTSSTGPTTCLGTDGSIVLGTTNLVDGSYTVDYMDATPAAQTATMVVIGNVGTISGLSAGTYNDIAITITGCTSVADIDVVLSDPLLPVLALTSSSNPTTCSGADGSIVLSTTNLADGSYTVDYMDATPAAQTATMVVVGNVGTISGLSAGTYNDIAITVTNCTSIANIDIVLSNPGAPTLALTSSSNPTTCLGTDGSIVLSTTNLVDGSYTVGYMDATPAAQTATMIVVGNVGTISGLSAGTYNNITITNAGCTSAQDVDVVLSDPLVPVLTLTSSSNPTTCSGTDGSIVLGTTNLVDGSYTIDYMDAAPAAQTATMVVVGNVGTISGLSAGTYNDIAITITGCTSVADIDVVLSDPLVPVLALTSSSSPTTCLGTDGSIVLGTTNLADGSYTVDYMDATPAAQTATMVVVGNVGTISGLSAGTYNDITVTNTNCTSVADIDVVLSDPLVPVLALTSSTGPMTCLGTDGSIVLGTTNLVDGSYTVDYMDATPAAQTATMVVVGNVGTISGLSAGTYNDITVTNTNCTSIADIDVVLSDPPLPVLALTSSAGPTTCSGTDGSIVLGTTNLADGSYTVDYMDATPAAQTATMVVVGNVGTISGLSAGTYNDITVTNTNCTSVADIDVVLSDPALPVLVLTSSAGPTTCSGTDGSIVLGTTNLADGSYTVDYMDATPAAQTATMVVVGNVGTISGLSTGTYNDITVTNTNCTSIADIDVVLSNPSLPVLALTSSAGPTTCSGADGSIVLGTTNLVDGSYTVDYMDATPAAQTATMVVVGNVGTISGLSAGTYNDITITVVGCTSVADIDVVLSDPALPVLALTSSSNPTTCLGTDGSIVLSTTNLVDGSYTVDYMDATPAAQTATMVVVGNVGTISGLSAGTYNDITITNTNCTSIADIDVVLSDPALPVLALTSSTGPTTCLGTDGSIVLGTTNLADGSYTVDYMDATPAVQTATMVVVGNVGTISGLSAGTYNDITVTNTNCTSIADIDVVLSDPALPLLALTSSTGPTTCSGTDGSIVLGTTNLADGSYTVDYMDATPAAQTATMVVVGNVGTISGLSAGTYNDITVTNTNCTSIADIDVVLSDPALPILALTSSAGPTTCLGTDGSIVLGTTNLVDGSYTVDYMDATPAAQTATMVVVGNVGTISGLSAGTYNDITVTNTNCTSVADIDVVLSDPALPVLVLTSSAGPTTCSGTDGSIVLGTTNLADGSYTVDYMDATPAAQTATMVVVGNVGTISGLSAGTYNDITVTNTNCTSVADIDVVLSDPALPVLALTSSTGPTTCSGADGSIVLGTTNLVDGSYTVDYMDATPAVQTATMVVVGNVGTISGLSAGTYNDITVTNTNCTSIADIDVVLSDPALPVLALTSSTGPTTCSGADGSIVLSTTNLADGSYTVDYMDATPAAQTATMVVVGNVGTISGLSAGTYNDITVTNTNCTSIADIDVVLSDPALPVLALTSSAGPTTCSGTDGSIVLSTTNLADGSYTVDYMDATPAAQTATMVVVGNVGTISGLSAGTYNDITVTNTNCTSIANIDVVLVDPVAPVANAVVDMEVCDDDIDGLMVFDLTSNTNAIANGLGNVTVTYFTGIDASGYPINQVVDATAYTNDLGLTVATGQPIYVLVQDIVTLCYDVITFDLIVNTVTFIPAVDLFTCDDDNDTFGYFDLAAAELQMTGGDPNLGVTFHETLAEAEAGLGVIPTTVLYQNVDTDGNGSGDVQELFINITDLTTGCSYTAETIILNVIASPELPEGPLTYITCEDSGSADGFVVFDLVNYGQTVLLSNIDVNTVATDYTITYYTGLLSGVPDPAMIIANPDAYTNIGTPDQVIYASVMHTATGCEIIVEITLHVDLLPVANYNQIEVCDDDYFLDMDGFYPFNLLDYESEVTGGATDVEVDYFFNLSDAESGTGSMISDYTNFTNTVNPQVIYASVYNSTTGCRAVSIVQLHVNPNPTPLSPGDIEGQLGDMMECDGDVDGSGDISEQIAEFDLTAWETLILTGNGPSIEEGVSAIYYANADDAAAGINAIPNPSTYNNISNPQRIYISVVNDGTGINPVTSGTGCNTITWFDIYVPVPEVNVIASKTVICVDANGVPLTDTTLPVLMATAGPEAATSYDYQWLLNGAIIPGATAQTYSVTEPGDYTVTVSGPTDFDCINTSATQTITVSGSPDAYDASVTTLAFADSHQVLAVATSNTPGIEFWYSLDDGEPTTNGTFEGVSPGLHTVTITDGQGCWSDTQEVVLIDYPHFFTPNGDGINDTWAIIHQEGIPISQIYIFDRFGKLLKQLDPDSEGWDGTYNGNQMPATDYWFKIIYLEGADGAQKEFKAHFSIKR